MLNLGLQFFVSRFEVLYKQSLLNLQQLKVLAVRLLLAKNKAKRMEKVMKFKKRESQNFGSFCIICAYF